MRILLFLLIPFVALGQEYPIEQWDTVQEGYWRVVVGDDTLSDRFDRYDTAVQWAFEVAETFGVDGIGELPQIRIIPPQYRFNYDFRYAFQDTVVDTTYTTITYESPALRNVRWQHSRSPDDTVNVITVYGESNADFVNINLGNQQAKVAPDSSFEVPFATDTLATVDLKVAAQKDKWNVVWADTVALAVLDTLGGLESIKKKMTDMATYHEADQKTFNTGSNVTSVPLDKPDNLAEDDLLVALVDVREGSSSTASAPDGSWTLQQTVRNNDRFWGSSLFLFTKVATASEPTSYTFTISTGRRVSAVLGRVSGVDTADPIGLIQTAQNQTSLSITLSSIATSDGNLLLSGVGTSDDGGSVTRNTSFTPPSGMTEVLDLGAPNTAATNLGFAKESLTGASGDKTWTQEDSQHMTAIMFEINAGGGTTVSVDMGLDSQSSITPSGSATVSAGVSQSQQSGVDPSGGASASSDISAAQQSGVDQSAQSSADTDIGISQQPGVSKSAQSTANASISASQQAAIQQVAAAVANSSFPVSQQITITESGSIVVSKSLSQGSTNDLLQTASAIAGASAQTGSQSSVSPSAEATSSATVALSQQAAISAVGQAIASGAIPSGAVNAITISSGVDGAVSVSLALDSQNMIAIAGAATVGDSFQVNSVSSISTAGSITTAGSFSVALQNAIATDKDVTISVNTSLGQQAGISESAEVSASANLAQSLQSSLSFVGSALAEAGFTEATISGITIVGQKVELTVTKPDGRTLTITLENRTLAVSSETRTLSIPSEDRTFNIASENRTLTITDENRTLIAD